ncbi:hypothetical protein [Nonomuraea sp. NPDC052265]
MIFDPFVLFVLAILLGGVALFVVMSIQLWKLFCGSPSRGDRDDGSASR